MLVNQIDTYVMEQAAPRAALQRVAGSACPATPLIPTIPADNSVPQTNSSTWTYYVDQAIMAGRLGKWDRCQELWLAALQVANCFDQNDRRIAYTLDSLTHAFYSGGKLLDAQLYGERALWAIQAVFGKKHIHAINCMNNLAGIYYEQQKYAEAEAFAVQVLTEYNKALGPSHPDVGVACTNLAMVYQQQGKFGLAELMYERALPICKRELGPVDKKVVAIMENYATVLDELGHVKRSEQVRAELRGSGIWHMFDDQVQNRLTA